MGATSIDLRRALRLPLVTVIAGIVLFFAAALGPAASHAQTTPKPVPRASLTDIEDEVMCVVCGRPLSTSAGTAADAERSVIQAYIDQGLDKEQIKEQLVREFGKQILLDDNNPIAGAAPIIAAVIGILSIGLLLRRRIVGSRGPGADGHGADDADATPPVDPRRELSAEEQSRIDAELAERT